MMAQVRSVCYGSHDGIPSWGSQLRRADILQIVQSLVLAQLEDGSIPIEEATSINDVPDWDSIAHVQIVVAVENAFVILFEPDEYMDFNTVGEMIDVISRKLACKAEQPGAPANLSLCT